MAEQYTKTGPRERVGGFGRGISERFMVWSNRLSFVPFIGGALAGVLGMIGTGLESAGHLFQGRLGSAVTTAVTGAAATTTNYLSGSSIEVWWINAASGVLTGKSLGTHVRKGSEVVTGGLLGALGAKPEVLSSHPAGIGSVANADYAQSVRGPGYWMTREAQARGLDPRKALDAYRNGAGKEHVAALEASRARGAALEQGLA